MKASLEGFFESLNAWESLNSEACIIMGDMNELGRDSLRHHRDLGEFAGKFNPGQLVFVGNFANQYAEKCSVEAIKFEDTHALGHSFGELVGKYKYIFIKGSRSLQLERILDIK